MPDGDYASYIEANSGARILPGNFVLSDGTVVGGSIRESFIIPLASGKDWGCLLDTRICA